ADAPAGDVVELRHHQRVSHPVVVGPPPGDAMARDDAQRGRLPHPQLARALAVIPHVGDAAPVGRDARDGLGAEQAVEYGRGTLLAFGAARSAASSWVWKLLRTRPPFVNRDS